MSDPICNSAGCTQYLHPDKKPGHPVDYFVPNFGVDRDIADSQAHEAKASAALGHEWTPQKDKDDKWILPEPSVEFKLAGMQQEMNIGSSSDPICASSGWCGDVNKKKKPEEETIYPIYPLDPDMTHTRKHYEAQEAIHGPWKLPKEEELQTSTDIRKKSDPACNSIECETRHSYPYEEEKKPVLYPYSDETTLDQDIKNT